MDGEKIMTTKKDEQGKKKGSHHASFLSKNLISKRNRRIYKLGNTQVRSKWVTREIAALDFLMSIPMEKETQIVQTGQVYMDRETAKERMTDSDDDEDQDSGVLDAPDSPDAPDVPNIFSSGEFKSPVPGRRLRGVDAFHIRFPLPHRYKLLRFQCKSADVRQWEQKTLLNHHSQELLDGRMFFSSNKAYPVMILSVIKYKPLEEEAKRTKYKRLDGQTSKIFETKIRDWRGTSYSYLLKGARKKTFDEDEESDSESAPDEKPYIPGFLDDPKMIQGKHVKVMVGNATIGPIRCSTLQYVKPRDLKNELNQQFRERHPDLPPSLTLSKIRSLKQKALYCCLRVGIEIGTLALCCVYFERLCLNGLVTKSNRRLCMAACLVLAFKFNEPLISDKSKLRGLLEFFDHEWFVSSRQVFKAEFGLFVKLHFSIHEKVSDTSHHFLRLLKMVEVHPRDYIGDAMFQLYMDCLVEEDPQSQALQVLLDDERDNEEEGTRKMTQFDGLTELGNATLKEALEEGYTVPESQATPRSNRKERIERWKKAIARPKRKMQKQVPKQTKSIWKRWRHKKK